ncbi:MAG: OmpA family protein [Bacteroidota bacterium]|nr:OmpA family protein [Bacteroidota bacterium]
MNSKYTYKLARLALIFVTGTLLSACGGIPPGELIDHDGVVAENLGEEVNSSTDDYAMFLYNNRLYYTSDRPTAEGYIQGDDFWFTDRDGSTWSRSLNYGGKVNTQRDEGSPFITGDGEWIYFVMCGTEDGLGDCDIYAARMDFNGKWQEIRNLGDKVNSKYWDSHPYLSPDGEYLYFSSDRPGGEGGCDIWRSKRMRSGRWGTPQNLGPEVNSGGDEKAPTMAPNGEDLFFTSDGHPGLGGYDLFRTRNVKRSSWMLPENIGKPFNSSSNDMFFRLTPREDTVFVASSRAGGRGELDLYAVWPNPYKDSTRYIYYVRGVVFDTLTEMGISGARLRVEPDNGAPMTITANRNGRYEFRTELKRSYRMTASAEGYQEESVRLTVPEFLYYNEYRKSIGLASDRAPRETTPEDGSTPIADTLTERNVTYFEFDRSVVLDEFRRELKDLYESELKPMQDAGIMYNVILDAHTDDRGTEDYNYNLSRRRGAAVSRVLRDLGVPLEAIRINAYGEKRLITDKTTLEAHSMNRRVELRVSASEQP